MAEFRNAICLVVCSLCVVSSVVGEEFEPVVKLSQPINCVQTECECSVSSRDEACPLPKEPTPASEEEPVASATIEDIKLVAFQPAGPCNDVTASGQCDSTGCACATSRCATIGCDSPDSSCSTLCKNRGDCVASVECDSVCNSCRGDRCSAGLTLGNCIDQNVDWSCLNLCCQEGFWFRSESLLWWTSDDDIPVLATSSPIGTPVDDAGVLGLPTTTDLFSDPLFGDARRGGRLRFGWWATKCKHGLEGSVWGLLNEDDQSAWESEGDPIIARPFFNVDPLVNGPDSQLIAQDGVVRGRLRINTSSEIFGGDVGIRKNICCSANVCGSSSTRLDCYAGYRYFKVREGVRVLENLESTSLAGPVALGTTIDLYDDYQTRNEFNGGTIGFVFAQQYRRLTAETTARLSLGNLSREVRIDGATTVTVPTTSPVSNGGGLLAQSTNIGTYRNDDFAVLPEVQFNLLYNLRCNKRLVFGYTFMYLGDLVRPGDVIDPTLNGQLLAPTLPATGPQRPSFTFQDSRTWLMGLSLGFQMDF